MKLSLKGLTGAATMLAAALGLNLLGPHRAYSAPALALPGESDLGVTILSPDPHVPLTGLKPVEISAFYQGTSGNQIVSVDLILDGSKVASKTLDVPETRGVVSFLVDASQMSAGTHKVVVRATAADQEVKSAKSEFTFGTAQDTVQLSAPAIAPLPSVAGQTSGAAPTLRLITPTEDGKVRGIVTLHVEATDPSGKAPYVSLFIDKTFKTLRNYAPYEFEWDTTAYSNGIHTIEAFGYNDSPNVGHSQALSLSVNNPGGETHVRRDLLDGVKTVKAVPHAAVRHLTAAAPLPEPTPTLAAPRTSPHLAPPRRTAAAPKKALGRPLPLRRPDLLMADTPPQTAFGGSNSTRETLARIARGADSLRFGHLNFAPDLSAPFEDSSVTVPAAPAPKALTPTKGFKPLPAAPKMARAVAPDANPASTPVGGTRRGSGKIARTQPSTLRLPDDELTPPFLAAPRAASPAAKPVVRLMSYRAEMHFAHSVVQPALKMHPLRVHFPASLGSLLRSVGQTSVLFNHVKVQMDRPISDKGGIVFGPLRQIFEQGGGSLTWQSRTGTVRAKNASRDIVLTIGQSQALVNTKAVVLEGRPYLIRGRTMVPLSFVSMALNADVQYDAATGHLLITSKK